MGDHIERFAENVRRVRRRAGISAETLIRLIGALGTTPDEILEGIAWRPEKRRTE